MQRPGDGDVWAWPPWWSRPSASSAAAGSSPGTSSCSTVFCCQVGFWWPCRSELTNPLSSLSGSLHSRPGASHPEPSSSSLLRRQPPATLLLLLLVLCARVLYVCTLSLVLMLLCHRCSSFPSARIKICRWFSHLAHLNLSKRKSLFFLSSSCTDPDVKKT
ncbi:hypothetical protein MUK42_04346 [Musa troglodytarum]|uniref:Uncharacterized protein n=1 Tax=Musa troglodytarum TaxID=320322 RepID=A0A9E7KZH3_9LILI|nr:hypothetical protein MUK42_04346 [Musa troglodytarum]